MLSQALPAGKIVSLALDTLLQYILFNIPQRKGDPIVFDTDEYPKRGTSIAGGLGMAMAFEKL